MKFCRQCGKEINEEAYLCVNCGCRVDCCNKTRGTRNECANPALDARPSIDAVRLVAYLFIGLSLAMVALSLSTIIGAALILISKAFYIIFQIGASAFAIVGLTFAIISKEEKTIAAAAAVLLPSLFIFILIFV